MNPDIEDTGHRFVAASISYISGAEAAAAPEKSVMSLPLEEGGKAAAKAVVMVRILKLDKVRWLNFYLCDMKPSSVDANYKCLALQCGSEC